MSASAARQTHEVASTRPLTVRLLRREEWETARDVRLRALRSDPDAFIATFEDEAAFDDDLWRARMDSDQFGAVDGAGRSFATAALVIPDDDPAVRELVGVWVDPDARRGGVGKELIALALDTARSAGVASVRLWVLEGNHAAQALYELLGFAFTGERTRFVGAPEDDLRMVARLDGAPAHRRLRPGTTPGRW